MIALETDLRRNAGPSLADLMLARGAQLPTVAPRTVEQAVTKAAQAQPEDETIDIPADVTIPADAPCTHASCLWAAGDICVCYHCVGAGHGFMTKLVAEQARARTAVRIEKRGIFGTLAVAGAVAPVDDPVPHRVPGLAAIQWDADGWPVD